MKAVVFERYGSPDVLELKEVEKPAPADDEVLVRVHAASLNDWDHGAMLGGDLVNRLLFGLRQPKPTRQILGSDVAGRVEAVGRNVKKFQVGDAVFGDLSGTWGYASGSPAAAQAPGRSFKSAPAMSRFEEPAKMPSASC